MRWEGTIKNKIRNPKNLQQQKKHESIHRSIITVLSVVEINVRVSERDTSDLVPANPNREDGGHLAEEIVELALGDGGIEISDVKRGVVEAALGLRHLLLDSLRRRRKARHIRQRGRRRRRKEKMRVLIQGEERKERVAMRSGVRAEKKEREKALKRRKRKPGGRGFYLDTLSQNSALTNTVSFLFRVELEILDFSLGVNFLPRLVWKWSQLTLAAFYSLRYCPLLVRVWL